MALRKNKTLSTIALILILNVSAIMVSMSTVNAHTPPQTIPTWCYVAVTNNPIGVNQQLTIVFWLNAYPPTASGAFGDRWSFTVEVTGPGGTMTTLGPFTSDPVGNGYAYYVPTDVGSYSVVAKFAGKTIDGTPYGYTPGFGPLSFGYDSVNDVYQASTSDPATFTVQQAQIQAWQEPPIPTGYWTVPVNSMNRNWYPIVSNWLAGAAQNNGPTSNFGYGKAPESAHVLWATPMWAGGIMDARFGAQNYETFHYEGLSFTPPIILNGKIYYDVQSIPREGWYCVDLYTGKTEYFHNTTGPVTNIGGVFDFTGQIGGEYLSFGQIYNYASPNQYGGFPYLWSTGPPAMLFGTAPSDTWMMFDAYTGNYICSIGNVPMWVVNSGSGGLTNVYGKDGSILYYNIAGQSNPANPFAPAAPPYYLQCWNTSRAIWYNTLSAINPLSANLGNAYWMWRPTLNYTFDGNNGYSLNVSIPNVQGSVFAVREDQYVIGGTSGKNNGTYVQMGNLWALSLKAGQEGTLLWNITYTPPQTVVPDVVTGGLFGSGLMVGPTVDPEDGVFLFSQSMTRQWWGFSLADGHMLWGPTAPESGWDYYGMSGSIYQGKLMSYGLGGEIVTYDIKTGSVLWRYTASQTGFESPYGNYPLELACFADGKVYMWTSEHHQIGLLWRGSDLRCIDVNTGTALWKINHWGSVVEADGYLVGLNYYDNQIYCYGIGPSATTVTTSPAIGGSGVLIQGTVIDQSPGAKGTPAVSDADQQAQMEYLYQQQAKPTNANGVPVTLTALGPNGNMEQIGTVTSDANGLFHMTWTPSAPGNYVVTATFAGSKAYGGSSAETALSVSTASASASASSAPLDLYIIVATILIIIAIAIVGILVLRKRP